jgi:hypothetical protein
MQAWLAQHPRRTHPGTRYIPETYGLTEAGLAEAYAGYRTKRGYP